MTDSDDAEDMDLVSKFTHMIASSAEHLVRHEKIRPEDAIRAIAASLWATVIAYSSPEHFQDNSEFAIEAFEFCRKAATEALKELEFDERHQGHQWGNA